MVHLRLSDLLTIPHDAFEGGAWLSNKQGALLCRVLILEFFCLHPIPHRAIEDSAWTWDEQSNPGDPQR